MTPAHSRRGAFLALVALSSLAPFAAAAARDVAYPNWSPDSAALAPARAEIQTAPSPSGGAGWSAITVPSDALYRRVEPRAIYDSVNHRTVVFGGLYHVTEFNDLWSLADGVQSNWEPIFPAGPIPHVRWAPSLIFDPVRDRMIMFGGISGQSPPLQMFGDLWQLSLGGVPTWSNLATQGTPPTPRGGQTAVYDPVRDRMLVFGGYDGDRRNDTWELSFATDPPTWSQLSTKGTSPPQRNAHGAIYDAAHDRMLVFGGIGLPQDDRNDTWSLDLQTQEWTELHPTGPIPDKRRQFITVYDEARGQMIVYGGQYLASGPGFSDVWAFALDGSDTWTNITPTSGSSPGMRWGHTAVYSPAEGDVVVFGGVDLIDWKNDTWLLSQDGGVAWTQVGRHERPLGRYHHSANYDPAGQRMLVFGGETDYGVESKLWQLDLSGGSFPWSDVTPASAGPSARFGHTTIFDPVRQRLVLYGGFDGARRGDTWELPLATMEWSEVTTVGAPIGRNAHSSIYDPLRDRMLALGGITVNGDVNEVWSLSFSGVPEWTQIATTGDGPPPLRQSTAVYDPVRDRMVVFGGLDVVGNQGFNQVWALDLTSDPAVWSQVTVDGTPPSGRWGASSVYLPDLDALLVFGGVDFVQWNNDSWLLPLGTPTWVPLDLGATLPPPRLEHSAIVDPVGNRMVIFGGLMGYTRYSDAWALSLTDLGAGIGIDVVPGDASNTVRLSSGEVPVALLSTPKIAASTINPSSVRFAGASPRTTPIYNDVNADGRPDLTLSFRARDLHLRVGDTQASVSARTLAGVPLVGRGAVTVLDHGLYPDRPGAVGLVFGIGEIAPHPVVDRLSISFTLAETGSASVELFDVRGRRVLGQDLSAAEPGVHRVSFNGLANLARGVYWLRLRQGANEDVRKTILIE